MDKKPAEKKNWMKACLIGEKFAEVFSYLKSPEVLSMDIELIRELNDVFDDFLIEVASKNRKFSKDNLKLLSISRGILLIKLSELEELEDHHVRMMIRKHIVSRKPLAYLVKLPYTFKIMINEREREIYSKKAISFYRDVLNHTMTLDAARHLHELQMNFYKQLPEKESWLRQSLAGIESVQIEQTA